MLNSFLFSSEIFYVRNHLPVPEVDPETYELELEVEGSNKTLTFTLEDLKKFPKHTITASVMCAGNRRSDMGKVLRLPRYFRFDYLEIVAAQRSKRPELGSGRYRKRNLDRGQIERRFKTGRSYRRFGFPPRPSNKF